MNLAHEHCEACRADAPRVTDGEMPELLAGIPEWDLVTIRGTPRLRRVLRVEGWEAAVELANRIAELAQEQDHHPSLTIEWGKVTVQWWTHAISGLHRNDFVMAAKVDDLVREK